MPSRRIEEPLEDLDSEAYSVLVARHDRIKSEIRKNLTRVIAISGGAITASLALLEKIAPKRLYLGLLEASWAALALAVVIALGVLVDMTMKSIAQQDSLGDLYRTGKLKLFRQTSAAGTPGGTYFDAITERFPGQLGTNVALFVCAGGVLCALAFTLLNRVAK